MNKIATLTTVAALSAPWLTGCNVVHKPDINGSETQPIMHGWTHEQAGEYWLQSELHSELCNVISGEGKWKTAEQLAEFRMENICVLLPLAPKGTNPEPRPGKTYRQPEYDSYVRFTPMGAAELQADTILMPALQAAGTSPKQLLTAGRAEVWLKEPAYFNEDSVAVSCYYQQRGRGIYTLYRIANRGTYSYPKGEVQTMAAVIAVYPGGDSLSVNRGNMMGPNYYLSDK